MDFMRVIPSFNRGPPRLSRPVDGISPSLSRLDKASFGRAWPFAGTRSFKSHAQSNTKRYGIGQHDSLCLGATTTAGALAVMLPLPLVGHDADATGWLWPGIEPPSDARGSYVADVDVRPGLQLVKQLGYRPT